MLKTPQRKDITQFQYIALAETILLIIFTALSIIGLTTVSSRVDLLETQLQNQIDIQAAQQQEVKDALLKMIEAQ